MYLDTLFYLWQLDWVSKSLNFNRKPASQSASESAKEIVLHIGKINKIEVKGA